MHLPATMDPTSLRSLLPDDLIYSRASYEVTSRLMGLPTCPAHLCLSARAAWKRLARLLHDIGLLSGLDRSALAACCQAYGRWVEAEKFRDMAEPFPADGVTSLLRARNSLQGVQNTLLS